MPVTWIQVRDVLDAALQIPPEERASYLDEACPQPELRRYVDSLIISYEKANEFLEQPAFSQNVQLDTDTDSPEVWIGRRIGPYRVEEEIGEGGMGTVFRAVRADDEYHKRVAIKLVRGGFGSNFALAQFKDERQILAGLEHPNIARLLDGGRTHAGFPYLVMELVEGVPIDEYCDVHKLSIGERLRLFRTVCQAVQFAHQNLVIHRDLKPANIMVSADGAPKLLDFGIAKLVSPESLAAGPDETVSFLRMMTPEYASPEQVRGDPISTATDVYSLGVVFYLLLTGHHPYQLTGSSPQALVEIICDTEPVRPSDIVLQTEAIGIPGERVTLTITPESVSSARDSRPDKLGHRLAGDLDNIVLMALRKDPQRRYSSVEQFSEDIRRHLNGLPVRAREDTFAYRSSKFAKRHKLVVAAVALFMITLLGGIVATAREARIARAERAKAERRFNDVRSLANSLMFDVHDSIKDLPGATPARKLLVERALRYLDGLSREAGGDASLQHELATAYEKVGDVQGQFYTENLGLPQAALESYNKALVITEALVQADPRNIENKRQLATIYGKVGNIEWLTGNPKAAAESARKGLDISLAISAADPSSRSDRKLLAASYLDYGWKQAAGVGDYPAGITSCHEAITILEELLRQGAADKDTRASLTTAYSRLGIFQESVGRFPEALKAFQTAFTMREQLLAGDPASAKNRRYIASSHINIGNVLAEMNDPRGALPHQQNALAIFESLSAEDPKNMQLRQDLAGVWGNIGSLLTTTGDEKGAEQALQKALSLLHSLPAAESSMVIRFTIAKDQYRLGKALASRAAKIGNAGSSKESWREARAWFEKSLPVFIDLRDRKIATGTEAAMPDEVLKEISICDKALQN